MRHTLACLILVAGFSVHPSSAPAQWQMNGRALCTAAGGQSDAAIVTDGAGGAIVAWVDYRSGESDIFAQRVDASGTPQWTGDGVALCAAVDYQFNPTIASDGAGGAIVTWYDSRNGPNTDIYVQRVDASGVPQWTADGVALCTAANQQASPTIVADGAGGAVIAWPDGRSAPFTYDVYAQRVNAAGTPQWTANGVALCTAAGSQVSTAIVSDGASGAIVTWEDSRNGASDIYARRVNASGTPQWTADGVLICAASAIQFNPAMVADGFGGAVITWVDARSGADWDVYARRVNASGAAQWTADGVVLCTAAFDQDDPRIVADAAGGAIVTWHDFRNGTTDIYAQRVGASGTPQWTAHGVALCNAVNSQSSPEIVGDGAGGAMIAWSDNRNGGFDIYAQRVSDSGVPFWAADGVPLCTASGSQQSPAIVSDGTSGAIVAWQDSRTGSSDVYAQRVEDRYGEWGQPTPVLFSVADVPGDQGGKVKVNWYASGRDLLHQQFISHYSIWRATDAAAAVFGGPLVSVSDIDRAFSGPAIRVERTAAADYFWELVAIQSAIYLPAYAYTASTNYDSSAVRADHQFQVIAHGTFNQFINWPSNVVSGHSVDNLAPEAPLFLTAQRVGPDVNLRWNRSPAPDLRDYAVYRATASGVTPVPINFLAASEETVLVDTSAPSSALYYITTAFDVHENQSAPSNEASVGATTGVGDPPRIAGLTLIGNNPNPFTTTTTLRVGLPTASEVAIEVYDVAGRSVSRQGTATLAAGWRDIPLHARDARGRALPSGVYFYRVSAAGETITRKMVIAR
jgi:hypothetical protein